MTDQLKHDPLPWGYDGEETIASYDWDGHGYSIFPENEKGECVGWIADVGTEEDAEFIVRACNSYYLMLEALKNLENDDGNAMPPSAWDLVQTAIAKAEGK